MEDNPKLSTLYTTGIFFFILMYTGKHISCLSHELMVEKLETMNILQAKGIPFTTNAETRNFPLSSLVLASYFKFRLERVAYRSVPGHDP